jgi:hypothetical protein
MSVEFEENKSFSNYNYQPQKTGGIGPTLIRWGLAKDEAGAQKVMIVITILFFALSIYFFMKI